MTKKFVLKGEYIQLNQLLKAENLCNSGAQANIFIEDGLVMVNDIMAHEKRKKLRIGDIVKFENHCIEII